TDKSSGKPNCTDAGGFKMSKSITASTATWGMQLADGTHVNLAFVALDAVIDLLILKPPASVQFGFPLDLSVPQLYHNVVIVTTSPNHPGMFSRVRKVETVSGSLVNVESKPFGAAGAAVFVGKGNFIGMFVNI